MTIKLRLLELAFQLAAQGAKSSTLRRRAVSTAYYAVFHTLAKLCADEIIGPSRLGTVEYEKVYRALEHGQLRSSFTIAPLKDHATLKGIGTLILDLQQQRHRADYLPPQRLHTRRECDDLVANAQQIISDIASLSPDDRRTPSICLLFKNRPT